MKKIYNYKAIVSGLFAGFCITASAQVLTPYSGNNSIPAGTVVTLCSHAGCGNEYSDNASGYTVIDAVACAGITITGTYDTEGCCDDIFIYDGAGNGGTLLQSYQGNGTINYVGAPGQTLTVEFVTDGSVTYSGFQFLIESGPSISINGGISQYSLCSGHTLEIEAFGADTYTWSTGSNASSFPVSPSTNTVYIVDGWSNAFPNCPLSSTLNVTVDQSPVIALSGSSVQCGNTNPVVLTVSGFADSFLWSTGSTSTSISVNPMQATTYSVTGTFNTNGCTTTLAQTVLYSPNPSIGIFTPTTEICEGSSLNIFATGANTYMWDNGAQTALTTISPQSTTTYSVMGTNSYGCQGMAAQTITVNAKPPVAASASKPIACATDMITLTGTGANSYIWMANSFLSSGSMVNANPQTNTTYTVTGTDVNGCSNTAQVVVTISACTGIAENGALLSGMRVYPNPAIADFTIEFDNLLPKTIEVMDLTGRLVLQGNSEEAKMNFNVQGLSNGVYYVRARSGESTQVIKLVKQ